MILVFDAKCVLCSTWVRFILKRDHRRMFRFAPLQGAAGRALLERAGLYPDDLQTLLLVDDEKSWQYTAAIFQVLHQLGGIWRLAWICWLVPAPLRDAAYRWAARNRYRLFGKRDNCVLPTPADTDRFLN